MIEGPMHQTFQQTDLQRFKRSDDELLEKSNRANLLDKQGKYQEALKIYEEIDQWRKNNLLEISLNYHFYNHHVLKLDY